jgi:pimeloyl-ACP methyl ester carboxylesterase
MTRHIMMRSSRWAGAAAMLISATSASGQSPSAPAIPRARAERLYELAAARFAPYEAAHGRYVRTNNVRMHYLRWGNTRGVPLIWAPGTSSTAYEMAPFAGRLVADGYRVIAIDYYGHGETPIPDHEVSLWHVADDIAALMDSLGLRKAVIGGWSRGGAIAAAFYHAYPSRVLGLVVEDGGSFSFQKVNDRKSDDELAAWLPPGDSVQTPVVFPSAREAFIDAIQWSPALDRDDPLWALQTFALLSQGGDGQWMVNRGLSAWLEQDSRPRMLNLLRRPSLTPLFQWSVSAVIPAVIFRNLDVPMLIIDPVQDDDPFPASDQNQQLQHAHPSLVTHRIYQNTSHAAKMEHPDWFLRDVGAFMDRIKGRVSSRP